MRSRVLGCVLLCVSAGACVAFVTGRPLGAQAGEIITLAPVDDAATDQEFFAFRRRLLESLAKGDSGIVLGVAGEEPRRRFRGTEEALRADLRELRRLLELGGSFTTTRGQLVGRREFCAPYTYAAYPPFPRGLPERFRAGPPPWVVVGKDVPVYRAASATSVRLRTLSYALVVAGGGIHFDADGRDTWVRVDLDGGMEGWVQGGQIRSPEDYHACFAKVDGNWTLTRFARDIAPVD